MTPGEAVAVKRTIGTHMNIRTQETACEGVFVVVVDNPWRDGFNWIVSVLVECEQRLHLM